MEEGTSILFVAIFVLVLLSSFFSSAETVYSSVSKLRLSSYIKDGKRGSKKAMKIVENFDETISTILIGNNIVNITTATLSAKLAVDMLGENIGIFVSTFLVTIVILVFGEILPKSLAKDYADKLSLIFSEPLYLLIKIMGPVTLIFVLMKRLISRDNIDKEKAITEEELKVLVDIGEEEGTLNQNEKELVHRSLDFDDILVNEIFKHRIDIVAVDVNDSIEKIKGIFLNERYSRVPVYEGTIDNVVGILFERDFLGEWVKNNGKVDIKRILRKPIFVVDSMRISNLLSYLQEKKSHMAIVIDEYGGTLGLVTMEDILEELVGDIWDEHDVKEYKVIQVGKNKYEFDADLPVEEINNVLGKEVESGNYYTIGGWLVEKFQRIPKQGETLDIEDMEVKISEMRKRKITKVRISINKIEDEKLVI